MSDIIFKVPSHDTQLTRITCKIEKFYSLLAKLRNRSRVTDSDHDSFYEAVIRELLILGRLSNDLFQQDDKFKKECDGNPYLFFDKVDKNYYKLKCAMHKPYDKLKNRCFELLSEIDSVYCLKNRNKKPPNLR